MKSAIDWVWILRVFFQQGQCTSRKLIILYWTWLFCFRIWRGRNKTESGQARVVVVLFGRPLPRQAVTSHGTMEEMWELMRVILHRVKQRRIRKNHYWGKQTYFFAVRKISWQERALSIRKDIISCQYIHPTARECAIFESQTNTAELRNRSFNGIDIGACRVRYGNNAV